MSRWLLVLAAITVLYAQAASAQTAQYRRVANEMGMIVHASEVCGYPLSDDFKGGLETLRNGRWPEAFQRHFEQGKQTAIAAAALAGGRDNYCSMACLAHGPKPRGASGAFNRC
jgi:hypothetical protein